MYIEPKLKPLYANLKRLKIGEYLYTKEFYLFALENNFDEIWEKCKTEISKSNTVIMLGFHNTEEEEDAFMLLMSAWYRQSYSTFDEFILTILLNFSKWNTIKLDYTGVIDNLKDIGVSKEEILTFSKV